VPAWVLEKLTWIIPLVEKYHRSWEIPPQEADNTARSQEIQAIVSLRQKMDMITDALGQEELSPEAWVATIDILELFGHAYPTDYFPGGHLDPLRMIWFVLIRNAAVSLTWLSPVSWLTWWGQVYFQKYERDPHVNFPSSSKTIAEKVFCFPDDESVRRVQSRPDVGVAQVGSSTMNPDVFYPI
jgi:hypothetical protein